jgi:hypothetical protein
MHTLFFWREYYMHTSSRLAATHVITCMTASFFFYWWVQAEQENERKIEKKSLPCSNWGLNAHLGTAYPIDHIQSSRYANGCSKSLSQRPNVRWMVTCRHVQRMLSSPLSYQFVDSEQSQLGAGGVVIHGSIPFRSDDSLSLSLYIYNTHAPDWLI